MSMKDEYDAWIRTRLLEAAVGASLSEVNDYARETGFTVRQTRINGISQICTRDYRLDRLNVETVNDSVVKAFVG